MDSKLEEARQVLLTVHEKRIYPDVTRQASAAAFFIQDLFLTQQPTKEVVILRDNDDACYCELMHRLCERFIPYVSLLVGKSGSELVSATPFAKDYQMIDGQTTVYVCEKFS